MDDVSRLEDLEVKMAEQTQIGQANTETLAQILAKLNNLETSRTSPTPVANTSPAPVTVFAPLPTTSRIKPGIPPNFDGDRTLGRAFLTSCLLYFSLCPTDFTDHQTKIHWVLSYLKSGRAAVYADRVLRTELRTSKMAFSGWDAFYADFVETFCPENEAMHSLMRLESERYFQGRRNVDSYVDEFRDLIDQSGYTDPTAIVLKFRRGLNQATQDKIAESGTDRPLDKDLSGWYKAARRFDQNRLANEAFHVSASKRTPFAASGPNASTSSARTAFPFAFPRAANPAPTPTPLAKPPHASFPLHPGVPMDVDASRAKSLPARSCHRCGGVDHLIRECPRRFDVRHMTTAEREDCLEAFLADRDALGITVNREGDEEPTIIEREASEEDFVRSSG